MTQGKTPLNEIADSVDAHKTARSEPLPQPAPAMDFIRSLALGLPIQTEKKPVRENMNLEKMLEAMLDQTADKMGNPPIDETDHVSLDIPLLIRVLEHVREGVDNDIEIHDIVERMLSIREKGVLTMDDYNIIAGGDIEGTAKEKAPQAFAGQQQGESLDHIKKLAGI